MHMGRARAHQAIIIAALAFRALGAAGTAHAVQVPTAADIAADLRALGVGTVLTAASGAGYQRSLHGVSVSGLPSDYGMKPAVTVKPDGLCLDLH